MDQEGPHFINGDKELNIEGCTGRGISEEAAQKIWNQMVDFCEVCIQQIPCGGLCGCFLSDSIPEILLSGGIYGCAHDIRYRNAEQGG